MEGEYVLRNTSKNNYEILCMAAQDRQTINIKTSTLANYP